VLCVQYLCGACGEDVPRLGVLCVWLCNTCDVPVCALFRAETEDYGGSLARGVNGVVAASLHRSSRQCQILNPLSEARDQTCVLMASGRVRYR